jgi:hypothetical protein
MNAADNRSTALAQRPAPINATLRAPDKITDMLQKASTQYHLVSPCVSCGEISDGFSVAFSSVLVDIGDTYDTKGGGKRGLHRVVLDKIATAAGISWDPVYSRRLDNGRDPHYCQFQAVGIYKQFDGTECRIIGTKQMDLRAGSPQIAGMSDKELAMQRQHIVSHAETKARLRAIAALGIKRAYTQDELQKPFVVARLVFTGHSDDPEMRREFARVKAIAAVGGREALYGALQQAPATMAPNPTVAALPPPADPPPVGTVGADEDDVPSGEIDDGVPASEPPPTGAKPPQQSTARHSDEPRQPSGFRAPFGRDKGKTVEDMSDENLEWLRNAIAEKLANPDEDPRFRGHNQKLLAALEGEVSWRDSQR